METPAERTASTRAGVHALALACLAAVALIYTWPLASRLGEAIPGRPDQTDVTETVWSVGWVHYALTHGLNPWQTDSQFLPFGADLRFNVFGLLPGLLAFPFVPWLGVIGAFDLTIILTLFLNGAFGYWLVHAHVNEAPPALLAAVFHMLSGAVVWHFAAGRNALPSLWIVTASLLCLKGLLDSPRLWKGLALGGVLLAALITDLQVLLFTVLWLALYLGRHAWKRRGSVLRPANVRPFLAALFVFLVPFLGIFGPVISGLSRSGLAQPSLPEAAAYSFTWQDFTSPAQVPYIYGFDSLLIVIAALAISGRDGRYRFWLAGAAFFFVLSLGPSLQPTPLPLPYALAGAFPPLLQFRTPYRFVIPAAVGLTMVAGFVFQRLLARLSSPPVVLSVCAALIGLRLWYASWSQPFETQVYPDYQVYAAIAREAGEFSLIEIPFGIRSGLDQIGAGGERFQYYQHIHDKGLLNGSKARLPSQLFDFYRGHPVLLFFSGGDGWDQAVLAADLANVLGWSKARYILVHRSFLTPEQDLRIEDFLKAQPRLEVQTVEKDVVVYRVSP
jgi:hypothetical protein